MDRRQKKTRQAVFDSFTHLLEKKNYSNITVQEIIDEADIGRSTFYSHFETKDELLNALCKEIFDHVFSENLTKENTHDFSSKEGEVLSELTHILYHLRDNGKYIHRILSSESGDIFMRYFKKYLEKVFEPEHDKCETQIPKEYILHHLVCSFAETVRWWMNHSDYTPEDICSFFAAVQPLM